MADKKQAPLQSQAPGNVQWQHLQLTKFVRSRMKGQTATCIWFTGLSGAGKSTIASLLEQRLADLGRHAYVLDGDNIRHGLSRDLGFTAADRVENIRRVAEVAKLMVDAGLIAIACLISPYRQDRQMARELFEAGEFVEVYVSTPLDVCERRDPKGLYKKARAGKLANFTGIESAYEAPLNPEIVVDAAATSPEQCVAEIIAFLGPARAGAAGG
jgi:bifunctional enzyme CysN/CysC